MFLVGFTKNQFIRGGVGDLAKERELSKVGGWAILRNGGSYSEGGGVNTPLRTMGKYNINKLGTGLSQKKNGGWRHPITLPLEFLGLEIPSKTKLHA